MKPLELSCAAAALLLVLNLFVRFERHGRRDLAMQTVLGAIVIDSVLNPVGFATPTGLFKLPVGPYNLFLPELVITLALTARLVGRRQAARWSADKFWWTAFILWLLGAAVRGVLAGHSTNLVLFEAKALLYVGGSFVLAAGGHLRIEGLWRLIRWVAPLAGLVIGLDQLGIRVTADLPLVPLRSFGQLGADAATILGSLGLVGLLLVGPHKRSPADAGAALVLAAAPIASNQRAALIGWAISIAVAITLTVLRRWRWRRPVKAGTVSLLVLALGAALALPVATRLATEPATAVPLVGQLQQSFVSPAKRQSWQSRQYQWAVAPMLVAEHPWAGSGLGTTYWHFEVAQDRLIQTDVTHNVALDVLVRTGLFGVCLFMLALLFSARKGLVILWRSADEVAAAVCAGFVSVVAGLIAKGMVESILEKYRIAVLLGLSLGALGGAAEFMGSSRQDKTKAALARSNGGY